MLRSLGVSPKCIWVACSTAHCFNYINYNNKFRLLEPQSGGVKAKFNSKAYEWKNDKGAPLYGVKAVVNDYVGGYTLSELLSRNTPPEPYIINYPGKDGTPDPANKCPESYSIWEGEGDQTYFDDVCP